MCLDGCQAAGSFLRPTIDNRGSWNKRLNNTCRTKAASQFMDFRGSGSLSFEGGSLNFEGKVSKFNRLATVLDRISGSHLGRQSYGTVTW